MNVTGIIRRSGGVESILRGVANFFPQAMDYFFVFEVLSSLPLPNFLFRW